MDYRRFADEELIKYQYVSFDVFDTLIKRNVATPKEIFAFTEKKAKEKFGNLIEGFVKRRIDAEREARAHSNREDITIDEIYGFLDYDNKIKKWCRDTEIDLEIKLCEPNRQIVTLYEYCRSNNIKTIILSDMYLPVEVIVTMLKKCGIEGWEKIYVSGEIGYSKAKGTLYRYMLEDLGISRDVIIHIGDNRKSDYKKAKESGINAKMVSGDFLNTHYRLPKYLSVSDLNVYAFTNNTILSVAKKYRLGYECMGPLLFGFCRWLEAELKKEKIKDVFFFSRDGRILKMAFDSLYSKGDYNTHYFYVSRKALLKPTLAMVESFDEYLDRVYLSENVSVDAFLKTFGIEDDNERSRIEALFDLGYTIKKKDVRTDAVFHSLYNEAMAVIKDESQNQKKLFFEYLKNEGMSGKVAIVDIGWHGNMQYNLCSLLEAGDKICDVRGYYVGINCEDNHKDKLQMKGYLFDEGKNYNIFLAEKEINPLFELIFMAKHGSVKGYTKSDGEIKAVFLPSEHKEAGVSESLWNYQRGALLFIKKISDYKNMYKVSESFAVDAIIRQFTQPRLDDASEWGRITFKDIDEKKLSYARTKTHYSRHPKEFFSDYKMSLWKQGFLKEVFRADINYDRISKIIKKAREFYLRTKE